MKTLPLLVALLAPGPDFDTEVLPVLTRAGCNSGACHGSAAGRGGFKLSLWGSDAAADHDALVRDGEGRRVNLARPERSLVLLKPTGKLKHGGGRKLNPAGAGAAVLLSWLRAGATRSADHTLAQFSVTPAEKLFFRVGESLTLKAEARFSDGTRRDVTPWTVFTTHDPAAVDLDASGTLEVRRTGQHIVLARFLDRIVAVRLSVALPQRPLDPGGTVHNFIDDEVLSTLRLLRLPPGPTCDDGTYLRRLALDLTGTLPTPEQLTAFRADGRPDKRERLVESLLAAPAFVDFWTLKWANRLRISARSLGPEAMQRYHGWMRDQVARNRPLDEVARDLLTALGDSRRVGPANFPRVSADAREQAELAGRVFLGVRLQCANCHDHPLDHWKQDDYHGLAAVFARLERGVVVKLVAQGEVIHPRSGEAALPRLPGVRNLSADGDHRGTLAEWITAQDNPLFARAAVNRLWKEMMGRGLVEPVDDLRTTNPATHPRLLERLAADFTAHGYDARRTLRLIATSATYQRAGRGASQPDDEKCYSYALARPLSAEVLADALADVTGVADRHGDYEEGTRAIALPDPQTPSPTLEALGRCARIGPCEEEATKGGLARTLHLINGPLLNAKIGAPRGRLRQLLGAGRSPLEIVAELYRRALAREPNAQETAYWKKAVAGLETEEERRRVLEDFLWALLTSKEFTTNH